MKCLNRLLILLCFAGALCCTPEGEYKAPEFSQVLDLEFEILAEEAEPYAPSNIKICGDYILVSGYSGPSGNTFFVFDKCGNLLKSGINKGRGPAETNVGYMRMSVSGGEVSYTDILTHDILSFSLENFMSTDPLKVNREILEVPGWCTYVCRAPRGETVRVISRSYKKDLDLPQRRIEIERADGTVEKYETPVYEDREISWFSNMTPMIACSPDGMKMAVVSSPGMTMEFFSLDGTFRRTGIRRYHAPDVDIVNGRIVEKDGYVFGPSGKSCATETELYVSYDGETTMRDWKEDPDVLLYRNIAVFDWEGNPKRMYRTKYRTHCFCIDESEGVIYAFLQDKSGMFIFGKSRL